MKTRRRVLLVLMAVVFLAAGIGIWLLPSHPPEPSYKGKTLSAWLVDLVPGNGPGYAEAKAALLAIGTNAAPFLVQALRDFQEPSSGHARARLYRLADTVVRRGLHLTANEIHDPALNQFLGATRAFEVLGPLAGNAVPELTRLLSNTNMGLGAAMALAQIGPAGAVPLIAALTNALPQARFNALLQMSQLGTNAIRAVPAILNCLKDTNLVGGYSIRSNAILALISIPRATPDAVPALVRALTDPDSHARWGAANLLGDTGPAASAAVPDLKRLLEDPDATVQATARNALRAIENPWPY